MANYNIEDLLAFLDISHRKYKYKDFHDYFYSHNKEYSAIRFKCAMILKEMGYIAVELNYKNLEKSIYYHYLANCPPPPPSKTANNSWE